MAFCGTHFALPFNMSSVFRALVVGDNPSTQKALQNVLVRLGYGVTLAEDSDGAIRELQRENFDAVFSELCIRDAGGRGIARWVRDNCLSTKCFILTSWRGNLENDLLNLDGINGVVRKPIVFNEVRDTVIEHFG